MLTKKRCCYMQARRRVRHIEVYLFRGRGERDYETMKITGAQETEDQQVVGRADRRREGRPR